MDFLKDEAEQCSEGHDDQQNFLAKVIALLQSLTY